MKDNGLMTGVVMVLIFAAGIFLGYYFGSGSAPFGDGEEVNRENNGSVTASVPAEGMTINTSALSDTQRKMLETMGVDTENLTLTPEMVACAEAEVGSARLMEIKDGASPSMSESASLMGCYN